MSGAEAALAFRTGAPCTLGSAKLRRRSGLRALALVPKWPGHFGIGISQRIVPPPEAGVLQRVEPHEAEASQLFRCFSQRAFAEMTMTDAAVKAVGFAKRTDGKEIVDEGRSGENSRLHQGKHGEKRCLLRPSLVVCQLGAAFVFCHRCAFCRKR